MMLLLLDEDFKICGTVEQYESLVWRRRYFAVGSFTLTLPAAFFRQVSGAAYLFHPRNNETAVIESIDLTVDRSGKRSLSVSGRMLECLFERRVIEDTARLSGGVGAAVNNLVRIYAMTHERKIPYLRWLKENSLNDTVNAQMTGVGLLEALYTVLKPYQASFSLTYNAEKNRLEFSAWKGLDRTQSQTENGWAVFSTSLENIAASAYSSNTAGYCNFAYVYGAEQDGVRPCATVDKTVNGQNRRELYVDAHDLKKTTVSDSGTETALTDEQFRQLLIRRGEEALERHAGEQCFTGALAQNAAPVYRVDYDLGDVVSLEDAENGISAELRVTELIETWRDGGCRVDAVFGKKTPDSVWTVS